MPCRRSSLQLIESMKAPSAPAGEIVAALAVHIGAVVIDALMPTSQPAEEAQSAGRDSGKHD
jgi:hypothetical protein